MSIEAGRALSHYRLVQKIGEGGMGEVWLAADVRLDREVAVKILPADFAANEQSRARFEREGKTISALNHPHICTLYDVGRDGDTHFLVMEHIQGESLADRLQQGPLPLDQVLELGAQIASALAAAHRLDIVHRDLKPANVMLTRAGAKLLDFGLAKTAVEAPLQLGSQMPTQGQPLTQEGMILGTFQYMAPEQLEGLEADARTDIFALGALLYEMATGRRAFEGKTRTSLIAAIVTSQPPPISSVQPVAPAALDRVVRRCLEKEPDERWQSAHDVAAELRWIRESGSQPKAEAVARPATRRVLPWALVCVLAAAAIALAALQLGRARSAPALMRASLSPPDGVALVPFDERGLALSPDGRRLAFAGTDSDGGTRIWIRELSRLTAEPLPESGGGRYPFWSPDGTHLAFFADGKLKSVDLRGGSPHALTDAPSGRGGSWGPRDVILFAPNILSAIHSVPATGGPSTAVTSFDPERETTHRWPHFLPDGEHFLYVSRALIEGRAEIGRLVLASLKSPQPQVLIEGATNAVYVEPGYLVYGRDGDLLARRFDASGLRVLGEPLPLATEKLSYWEAKNFVPFAASNDGTIIYLPESTRQTKLVWYDRTGRPLGTIEAPGYYADSRISPDGSKIATVKGRPLSSKQEIWIRDLEQSQEYRLTFESGRYAGPAWSRDGTRVGFVCQPKSAGDLCVKTVGEGSAAGLLLESPSWKNHLSWLPGRAGFVFVEQSPETGMDLWLRGPAEGAEPRPLLRTPFQELSPEVSPDGHWLAYVSDETGHSEVYLREVAEVSQQWQLSRGGGSQPRWRGDGRELFYAAPDGGVMAVTISTEPVLRAGAPQLLFELPEKPDRDTPLFEDVTPDGQRFLLNLPVEARTSVSFHAIFDWTAMLGE